MPHFSFFGLTAGTVLLTAATVQAQAPSGRSELRQLAAPVAAQLRQLPLDSRALLRQELGLRPADGLLAVRTETDDLGQVHERYQQTYLGVKVEHGLYTVHRAAGVLSGEWKLVPQGLSVKPQLSAAAALRAALGHVGAQRYMWDDPAEEAGLRREQGSATATYRPQGELVLVEDFRQPEGRRPLVLAWKFNIYAQEPLSRAWVFVDARTGQVVLTDDIIKHAGAWRNALPAKPRTVATPRAAMRPAARPSGTQSTAIGTFATRYVGSRQVATDLSPGGYRLRDYTRAGGIETYNLRTGTNLSAAVDFIDLDNNWTAAEYNNAAKDDAALDAHFGSTQVHDYWLSQHNRNSYDGRGGKLVNYVHYRANFDNASWNGTAMQYGDGNVAFTPLTCLDVCAHETGHGICQETAGLIYMNESGALNEGFSDIWGAAVEYYAAPNKQTWIVGEDISRTSGGLRSMIDPLSAGVLTRCPANYRGQRWNFGTTDNGGVHTNSGVLNHWFYILSVGKTGVNEQRQAYSVTGITIQKAARIAYRAERLYLSPTSDYRSARVMTIQAATDLYGAASPEVQATIDAWYAVGLGLSSTAPAGAQAQCPTDDAATLTATASATTLCAGEPLTLTAGAAFPALRRLRSQAPVAIPDGAMAYTPVPLFLYSLSAATPMLQRGLERFYRDYTTLTGLRVRLRHDRPAQVGLRLAVRSGSTVTPTVQYVNLAAALPAYTGTGPATFDLTFADTAPATATLPAALSGNSLTGSFRAAQLLGSITPGSLVSISLEVIDNQAGSAGTVELAELLFARDPSDEPTVRWVGPGLDVATDVATTTAPAPAAGAGTTTYRYTALASDPFFGCTSQQSVSVTVRQPLLAARALQPELCVARNQPFGPVDLRVTQDDSLPGQTYRWTGPNGFAATGKRSRALPSGAGRLVYTVSTTAPGSTCATQQSVAVLARRPAPAAALGSDTVVTAGSAARLVSRGYENQMTGPYRFTGSAAIPDNNLGGVRIPLAVAGRPQSFFDLRGIRVSLTHTYIGELELYVEAPDGTRVLLSRLNGGAGQGYTNTLFVDSVGAQPLNLAAAPFTGTFQADEPTGFAKLRGAPQAGTWNLWVRDTAPNDRGSVTAWGLVTNDNRVTWSGPNGFSASGTATLSPVLTVPGRYRYLARTGGTCPFTDTVTVRVARGLAARTTAAAGFSATAQPVPFGTTGFALSLSALRAQPAATVEVLDLAGRRLLLRTAAVPAGASALALPETGRLAAGVYLVRLRLGDETQVLRVVRE